MRLHTSAAQEFRLQAICRLRQDGLSQSDIAARLNCTQAWVSKVLARAATEGASGLSAKTAPGHKPALQPEQLADLSALLEREARAADFDTDGWTCQRVAQVVFERYQVRHHPSHISRLLQKIGFTRQKPQRQDYRHDPEAARAWREETLPQLKKSLR